MAFQDGDITVWISNGFAFARLEADTPAGPIIVQASAPLAAVRERLAQLRGEDIAGDDRTHHQIVCREAKRSAVGNLRRLAPYAFPMLRGRRSFLPHVVPPEIAALQAISGDEMGDASSKAATQLALGVAKQDPRVKASLFLLRHAKRDPRARRRIKVIKARAADGDPQAQQSLAALRRAQNVDKVLAQGKRKQTGERAALRRMSALAVPRPPTLSPSGSAPMRRLGGFFAAYDRGAE